MNLRLLLFLLCLAVSPLARAAVIEKIEVVNLGPGKLEEDVVRAYTHLEPGDEFSRDAVARDVKDLQKSGKFAFVSTRIEQGAAGVVLIYDVKLRSRVRFLTFIGNEEFSDAKLRKIMEIEEGTPVDDTVIAVAVQKIKDKYIKAHFPFIQVVWETEDAAGTLQTDLKVTIREGKKALIRKISFQGGEAIPKRQLKKLMQQKPWHWFSWITGSGKFNPDQLPDDLDAIRNAYFDAGYLDAQVGQPEIVPLGKTGVEISIPIEQGVPYKVGNVDLSGVTLFPVGDLQKLHGMTWGETASLGTIRKAGQDIEDYYGSRGYMRSRVDQVLDADPYTRIVDVHYRVKEGQLAYIRDIQVKGNTRTRDKVIRRELAVYPGEKYDQVRVRRSEQRLRNLGYFNTVFASPEATEDPSYYDLAFTVDERKTGQFVVGAGFSSVDDLIGFIELSQGNFDLFGWPYLTGGGQKIKFRAQLGTSRNDLEFSFTEPWFLNRRLSLNFTGYRSERRFLSDDYDQVHTGGSLALGKYLGGYHSGRLRYALEEIEVTDVSDDASDLIKLEEGSRLKSSMRLEHTYDSRDSVFIPTRGSKLTTAGTLSGGPLGAETDLYQFESGGSTFFTLWFDHVLSFRGNASMVEAYGDTDHVPLFDREFLGGARTLRGFKYRDVGPRAVTTFANADGTVRRSSEPIGGKFSWFASSEYTIPIVEKIRFAVFYDIGAVEDVGDLEKFIARDDEDSIFEGNSYYTDWGIGIRFDLPQFPLRLDYAWPLETDEFNDRSSGRFNFLIGYTL